MWGSEYLSHGAAPLTRLLAGSEKVQGMLYPSTQAAKAALSAHWRWPHFSVAELACRCGGRFCKSEYCHDSDFLNALEALRETVGRPLIVNSGHRCAQWNARVGGAPHSFHKHMAVDLSLIAQDRFSLRDGAIALGFNGIGMARTFLHLDRRPRPARWFYKGARPLWET